MNITHTPGKAEPVVSKPKAPSVTTYLGTIKVAYDDLTAFNLAQSPTASEIEVYFSQQSGFTPGPTNFYGKFPANKGSYIIIPGTELTDGVDYYIKIIVRDIYGNITDASEQVSVRAKLSDIVTFDMIDVGTLTGQVIIGLDIRTSPNPSVGGGLVLNQQGMVAYDPLGTPTFRLNALNGAVTIGDYLGKEDAAGIYLGKLDAAASYATIGQANGIAIVAGNAKAVADAAQLGVNSARADLDAVTELGAGSIRVMKRDKVLGSINENSNTTTIEGGKIRTGSLNADRIGAGTIDASVITVDNISASRISSGILTGRRVQTASSGQRAVLQTGTFNRVELYNPNGSLDGYISSTVNGAFFGSEISPGYVRLNVGGSSLNANNSYRIFVTTDGDFGVQQPRRSSGGNTSIGAISGISGKAYVFADLGGNLTASTSTSGVSDSRVKTNVVESPLGLNLVDQLKPIQFDWLEINDADVEPHKLHKQYGFLAQDVEATLDSLGVDHAIVIGDPNSKSWSEGYPNLEISDENPLLTLDQIQLIPALVKSIQELSARIKLLETQTQDTKDTNNG